MAGKSDFGRTRGLNDPRKCSIYVATRRRRSGNLVGERIPGLRTSFA